MSGKRKLFGVELRRIRVAAGLSLAGLASQVHYSKGYLSKIETGDKPPGPDLARRCDAALGADGALAALVERDPAQHPPPAREREDNGEVWMMSLTPDGNSWCAPVSRRDALAAGASSLLGMQLTTRGLPAAARQTSTAVAFRALFDQTRKLGQMTSPSVVLPMVIAQTQTVRGLAAAADSRERTALLQLAARFAEFTGWMSQEAGDNRTAMRWTSLAVELAAEAGDTDLAAHSLVRQALITLYRDDAAHTVELASQAQRDPGVPARIRGFAALREAQGHAIGGDEYHCRQALDRAAGLLDQAAAQDSSGGLELGPLTVAGFDAVVAGWCLHDLGRPAEAARMLDERLVGLPATARRAFARFGARRALAHATAGEVDHACLLTHQVLDAAELVDSATIRVDLRRLARTLTRWHAHPPVRELHPRLTAALHVPVH